MVSSKRVKLPYKRRGEPLPMNYVRGIGVGVREALQGFKEGKSFADNKSNSTCDRDENATKDPLSIKSSR